MVTQTPLPPRTKRCSWHGSIDGVIYTDGTYEGKKEIVRGLQARRDGIAAGVRFWAIRTHREATEAEANVDEFERRVKNDQEKLNEVCNQFDPLRSPIESGSVAVLGLPHGPTTPGIPPPGHVQQSVTIGTPDCEYWRGRLQVDLGGQRVLGEVDQWQAKIEQDEALKKLDIIFHLPSDVARER